MLRSHPKTFSLFPEFFFQLLRILPIDPFLTESAVAADIAMHHHRGENAPPHLNIVAAAVGSGTALHADDICTLTLGAGVCVLHASLLPLTYPASRP